MIARYLGPAFASGGAISTGTGSSTGYTLHTFTTTGTSSLVLPDLGTRLRASVNGNLVGSGALVFSGPGVLTLSGTNTYTGRTTVSAGTLIASRPIALPGYTSAGRVVFNGGTLQVPLDNVAWTAAQVDTLLANATKTSGAIGLDVASGTHVYASSITGNIGLTKAGAGTLTLTGSSSYSGRTNVTGGTLTLAGGVLGNGSADNTHRALTVGVASGQTAVMNVQSGTIALAGNAGLTVGDAGTGTLSVSGGSVTTSTGYLGFTAGSVGIVTVSGGTWSSGDLYVGYQGAGTLTMNGGLVSVAGVLSQGELGTINLNAGGTLQIGSGGTTGVLGVSALTTNGTLIFNRSDDSTYSGAISGSGAFVKQGAGTLTLTGSSSFTGSTRAAAGTLALENVAALAGSTLDLAAGDAGTVALSVPGTATYALGGLQGSRDLAIGPNSLSIGANGASTTYAGSLSGAGSLTKTGDGTLTLTGSNSFTGVTRIELGSLALGNTQALAASTLDLAAADAGTMTFTVAGTNTYAIAGLHGTRNLAIGPNTLSIGAGGASTTYAGSLSGSGGLTKTGAGTLMLTGSSAYTGGTIVSAGIIEVAGPDGDGGSTAALGTGTVSISAGARVNYQVNNDAFWYSGQSRVANPFSLSGGTLYVESGVNEFSGPITLASGSSTIGAVRSWITLSGGLAGAGDVMFTTLDAEGLSIAPVFELTAAGSNTGTVRVKTSASPAASTILMLANVNALQAATLEVAQRGMILFEVEGTNTYALGGLQGGHFLNIGANSLAIGAGGASTTYAGSIEGSGGLTKTGTGTLTLSGTNTYTGLTRVAAGTLALGQASTLAGSTLDLAAGDTGTVALSVPGTATYALGGLQGSRDLAIGPNSLSIGANGASTTYAGSISGSGGLTKTGLGTLTLTGTNTYTGLTTVLAGTLAIGNGGTTGSLAGNIANDSAVTFDRSDDVTYSGVISGSGSLTKSGAGMLSLTGSNSYTGLTTVSAGSLSVGNGGASGSIAGDAAVAGGTTLIFNRSDNSTYSGVISGSGAIIKQGAGTLTLTGSSAYTGGTIVSAGIIEVAGPDSDGGGTAALGTGTVSIHAGAQVTYRTGVVDARYPSSASVANPFLLSGGSLYAALPRHDSAVDFLGTITLASGSNTIGSATKDAFFWGGLAGDGDVIFTVVDAGESGVNADFFFQTFTLMESGSNTGTVRVKSKQPKQSSWDNLNTIGILSLNNVNALQAATLDLAEGDGGRVWFSAFDVDDENTYAFGGLRGTGNLDIGPNSLSIGGNGASTTYSGAISGSGGVTKTGMGTLTLSGTNTYSGLTRVAAGTLALGQASALAGSTLDLASGDTGTVAFTVSGTAAYALGGLRGSRDLAIGANSLSVGGNGSSTTYSGGISGSGGLTKTGTGLLTLSGTNTYSGQTTVSNGTLIATATSALPGYATADRVVLNGGTLQVPLDGVAWTAAQVDALLGNATKTSGVIGLDVAGGPQTVSNGITGGIGLTKAGAGTLTLTGTNTYTGLTTVAAGVLSIGNGGTTGSLAGDVANDAELRFDRSDDTTFGGSISGAGGVTKLGGGTLTLSGSNAYGGSTTVSNGILIPAATTALPGYTTAGKVVFDGGTLQVSLDGTAWTAAQVDALLGNATKNSGAIGLAVTSGTQVYSSDITGNIGMAKTGAGTLALTGSNTYTGQTTVAAGTLIAATAGSLPGTTAPGRVVLNGGTLQVALDGTAWTATQVTTLLTNATKTSGVISLDVAAGPQTLSNGITGGIGLTKSGAGTLTLSGTNTYTGLTTVAGGTLQIGSGGDSGSIAGNVAVADGATLAFNRAGNVTYAGSIGGSGGFVQQSPSLGTLTLTGSSSFTGPTRAASGVLVLGNRSALAGSTLDMAAGDTGSVQTTGIGGPFLIGGLRGSRNVSFSPEVSIGGNGESTLYSGQITAVGGFVKSGGGTLTLTGSNNLGSVRLDGGVLALGNSGAIGSAGQISFTGGTMQFSAANATDYSLRFSQAANQAFAFDTNGQNVTLQYILAGAGSTLTKSGAGTLTLASNAVNGITGLTTVTGGTLAVGNGGAAGRISGDAVVADGAALVFNRSDDVTYAGSISGAGTFTKLGPRTLTLTGNSVSTGLMTIGSGTLMVGSFGTTGAITADVLVAGGAALVFNRSDASSYAGGISGAGAVVKRGLGTLTLTGSSSFSGGMAIEGGTVVVGNANALGTTGPITLGRLHIGTMPLGLRATVDVAHDLTVHGDGTGLVTIAGDADGITYSGGLTLNRATTLGGTAAGGYAVTGRISGTVGTLTIDAARVSFGQSEANANTFVGSVAINNGKTLQLDSVHGLSSGHSVTANGALELAVGDGSTASISGLNGSGAVRIAASSGGTQTLLLGGNNAGGWFSGTLADGAGMLALRKVGWGTQILSGSNSYTGLTTVSAGILSIGGGGTTGSIVGDVVNDADLRFDRSDDTAFGGGISGSGFVTKAGGNTLTLTGSNSYEGGTNLAAGTLALGSADAIGSSGVISFGGGTLRFTAANAADYSARFSTAPNQAYALDTNGRDVSLAAPLASVGGSLAKVGAGTLTLLENSTFGGPTTVQAGTLRLGAGGTTGSIAGDAVVAGGAALVFDRSDDVTYFGAISGSGAVTKAGPGRLTLAGNGSYTGVTTVVAGTLSLEGSTATPLIRLGTVGTGASPVTLRSSVNVGGDITVAADGTGPVTIAGDGDGISFSGALNLGRAVTLGGLAKDRYGYSGRISGTVGTLTIDAPRITFDQSAANANTFVGSVVINSGKILQLNSVHGLSGSHAVDAQGSLLLNVGDGSTATIGTLTGGGFVGLHPGVGGFQTLEVGGDGGSGEFGGTFGDGGGVLAIRKVGLGTLGLAGNSTHTGPTTVAAGELAIGVGGTTGSLAGNIVNNARVRFDRSDDTTYAGVIGGSGTVTKAGAGTLTLTSANTFTGPTQILSGTLALGHAAALAGSTLDLAAGNLGAVAFALPEADTYVLGGLQGDQNLDLGANSLAVGGNGASTTYAGQLSGAGGLTKLGAGTLVLTGSNSYAGQTTVSAGALRVASPTALPGYGTADTVVFNGGTLELAVGNAGWTMPEVESLLANATKTSGAAGLDIATGSETLAAAVTGGIGLTKLGAGTLVLSAGNSFTGATRVAAGTLTLGHASALAGSTLDLAAGDAGTVALAVPGPVTYVFGGLQGSHDLALGAASVSIGSNGASTTYAGRLSTSGGLTKAGSGELVLAGSNVLVGPTSLAAGTLTLGHQGALGGAGPITFTGGVLRFSADNTADYGSRIKNSTGTIALDTAGQTVTVVAAIDATNTGGLTKLGSGRLVLTGSNEYAGQTTVSAGALRVASPAALPGYGTADTVVFGGGTLELAVGGAGWSMPQVESLLANATKTSGAVGLDIAAGSQTLAAAVTGGIGLTKLGAGTLVLSAGNSFTGATRVAAGTLTLGHASALAGSTLDLAAGDAGTVALAVPGPVTYVFGGLQGSRDLALGAASVSIGSNGASTTYAGRLSTSGGLTKAGSGELVLAGSNVLVGPTSLAAGTLTLGHQGALGGAGPITFTGGVLRFTADNTADYGSRIKNSTGTIALDTDGQTVTVAASIDATNTGGLTKLGAGRLVLAGSNAYSGGTVLQGGILSLGHAAALGSTDPITFAGGVLEFTVDGTAAYGARIRNSTSAIALDTRGQTVTLAGSIDATNGGGLTKLGDGTLTLSSANAFTGQTRVAAGTLALGHASALAGSTLHLDSFDAGGVAFTGPADTTYVLGGLSGLRNLELGALAVSVGANGDNTDYGGQLSGAGQLIKSGGGTLTLLGANSYTGGTRLAAGTLLATHPDALPGYATAGQVIFDGGALQLPVYSPVYGFGWTAEQVDSLLASATKTAGTVAIDTAEEDKTLSGGITGGIGLVKLGIGTLRLSGSNAFTGPTRVAEGALVLEDAGALAGSTLDLASADWGTLELAVPGATTYVLGGLQGGRAFDIGGNSVSIGANGSSTTYEGELSGAGGLIKAGGGRLTLTGNNSYEGGTTLSAGTLRAASLGTLPDYATADKVVFDGGTLELPVDGVAWTSEQVDTLLAAATKTSGAVALDVAAGTQTLAGAIVGGIGLVKLGDGRLVLADNNSYAGPTTLGAGTLRVGSAGALPGYDTAGRVVFDGGTLELPVDGTVWTMEQLGTLLTHATKTRGSLAIDVAADSQSLDGTTLGDLGLIKLGDGTLVLSGSLAAGTTRVVAGTLAIGDAQALAGSTLDLRTEDGGSIAFVSSEEGPVTYTLGGIQGSRDLDIGANSVLVGGNNESTSYVGRILGSGGLTKTGTGRLTLGGDNTFMGDTTVFAGRLAVNGTLGGSGVSVLAGADLGGSGSITAAVTIAAGGTLSPGNSIQSLSTGTATFAAGAIFAAEVDSTNLGSLATAADLLVVTGDLNLDPGNGTILTLTDLALTPQPFVNYATSFALINYAGGWNGGLFTFEGSVLPDGGRFFVGSQEWQIDYDRTTPAGLVNFTGDYLPIGTFVSIMAVPEPTTIAMGIGGLACLAWRMWRRKA